MPIILPLLFLGYSHDELTKMNIIDIPLKDQAEESLRDFQKLIKSGRLKTEFELFRKDGSIFQADLNAIALPNGTVFGICRDISARKQTENRIQQTLNATTDGIWYWHFPTNSMTFSPRYYTMLGYEVG